MKRRIKIVWLCTFSDEKLRKHLSFPKYYWGNLIRRIFKKPFNNDFAVWDSNARNEFEKFVDEVELHIIAPHSGISKLHEFEENGLYYHIFWEEKEILKELIKRKYNRSAIDSFGKSRKLILNLINKINPDLVHVIGIENKFHSMAALDISLSVPVIAQLQTLVSDSRFKENTSVSSDEYCYNSYIEQQIMLRSDYIATPVERFAEVIRKSIKPNAIILRMGLMLKEPLVIEETKKEFDFVYWALDISKTADLVLEAFSIANKIKPEITLDIIGGYSPEYKKIMDEHIERLGVSGKVKFEGKLPTHDDVLKQIRKSRFALLPLKIDIVSGTIREAMANGLPVLTTITPGTPKLNEKRECVMLSETGDHKALAENMIKLLDNERYANLLRENSRLTSSEQASNADMAMCWLESYKACIENFKKGTKIKENLLAKF